MTTRTPCPAPAADVSVADEKAVEMPTTIQRPTLLRRVVQGAATKRSLSVDGDLVLVALSSSSATTRNSLTGFYSRTTQFIVPIDIVGHRADSVPRGGRR